jgi:hypothetical protein
MSHKTHDVNGITDLDVLDQLNLWPEGSIGFAEERLLLVQLNDFCKKFGYGRVPQLAAALEDIWRNPDKIEIYRKRREEQIEFMNKVARDYARRNKNK